MNTSKAKRIALAFTILSFLFGVVGFSTPSRVRAGTACTPATPVSVPYSKDGVGDVCIQTTSLCDYINSWGLTTLEINGNSYLNLWADGDSIPPLNGTYAIRYVSTNPSGHFEIAAPCSVAAPSPTSTATNTQSGPVPTATRTATPGAATATRTLTPTTVFTATATRTNTPGAVFTPTRTATPPGSVNPNQVVNTYGRLQISGTQLRDQYGNAIQLAGMSSHGLTWFPLIDVNLNDPTYMNALKQQINFNPTVGTPFPYTSSAIGNLVDQWHIQVIRASMFPFDPWNIQTGTARSYDNNYPEWKWYNINLVNAIVQSAINENIYVIIDWHAGEGNDQDPTQYWTNGHVREFFTYMVDKWGSYPNVIYETVNSPVVGWNPTLKTFNQNVIDHIRAQENAKGYAHDSLIIAGTPTWSQEVQVATNDPLSGNMIAYNYMWYAGTHYPMGWVQSRGDEALNNLAARAPNQTVFMGEVGTSASDGNGGVYYSNFNILMEWAKIKKLSWLNWSIANKQETSAIFIPSILGNVPNNEIAWRGGWGTIPQAMASTGQPMRLGPWNDADYSCTGKFIKGWLWYNTTQPVPAGC